jgi:Domain of unknown function (DUF4440)
MNLNYQGRSAYILLLMLFITLNESCSNNEQDARQYIINGEKQWAETVATNDTSVLHRILANDFIWVLDGKVMTKKQAIADAHAGPGDFISDHVNKVSVRFFGNTAVAQGDETWTRKPKDGKAYSGKFVWSDTWVHRNGAWQIVQAEDITVPNPDK